jgi:hypothetical protein
LSTIFSDYIDRIEHLSIYHKEYFDEEMLRKLDYCLKSDIGKQVYFNSPSTNKMIILDRNKALLYGLYISKIMDLKRELLERNNISIEVN